jgi:transcription initiation factor IIE alpha subunit
MRRALHLRGIEKIKNLSSVILNETRVNKDILELGPTARIMYNIIRDNPGYTKEDIKKITGFELELIERILRTFRTRGIVSYRLLWHYEVMEIGGAL